MIKGFAEENNMYYLGSFNTMLDSRNGIKKKASEDEVHPTVEGNKVMEPLVEKAIESVLNK